MSPRGMAISDNKLQTRLLVHENKIFLNTNFKTLFRAFIFTIGENMTLGCFLPSFINADIRVLEKTYNFKNYDRWTNGQKERR